MLYSNWNGCGYAHKPTCFHFPFWNSVATKNENYLPARNTWYPDKDGVLTLSGNSLRRGAQLYVSKDRWVWVEKPGKGQNTDPARRIRVSDLQPDGTILLPNGKQLYANESEGRLGTEKQGTHTNTDPNRRTWTVKEAPAVSTTAVVGRHAAYWLLGVPLCPLCCVLSGLIAAEPGEGGSSSSGSSSSGSSSYDNGSGDGGDGG